MAKSLIYICKVTIVLAAVFSLSACFGQTSSIVSTPTPVTDPLSQGLLQQEYFSGGYFGDGWKVLDTTDGVYRYQPASENDYLFKMAGVTFGATRRNSHVFTIRHYLYCFSEAINGDTVKKIVEEDVIAPIKDEFPVNLSYSSNYRCSRSEVPSLITSINCYVTTIHSEQSILSLLQLGVSPGDMDAQGIEDVLNSMYESFFKRVSNINSCD